MLAATVEDEVIDDCFDKKEVTNTWHDSSRRLLLTLFLPILSWQFICRSSLLQLPEELLLYVRHVRQGVERLADRFTLLSPVVLALQQMIFSSVRDPPLSHRSCSSLYLPRRGQCVRPTCRRKQDNRSYLGIKQ